MPDTATSDALRLKNNSADVITPRDPPRDRARVSHHTARPREFLGIGASHPLYFPLALYTTNFILLFGPVLARDIKQTLSHTEKISMVRTTAQHALSTLIRPVTSRSHSIPVSQQPSTIRSLSKNDTHNPKRNEPFFFNPPLVLPQVKDSIQDGTHKPKRKEPFFISTPSSKGTVSERHA